MIHDFTAKKVALVGSNEQTEIVAFDVQFGTMKFVRGSASSFALISVEVTIEDESAMLDPGTRIAMDLKIVADPATETVLDITEKARTQIQMKLAAAAQIIGAKTSQDLLYGDDLSVPLRNDNDPLIQQVY